MNVQGSNGISHELRGLIRRPLLAVGAERRWPCPPGLAPGANLARVRPAHPSSRGRHGQ